MNTKMLAEWLRDIARHIEEDSPLIRDENALSGEGMARKVITTSFNVLGRTPQYEDDICVISRH